jgi:hypothetical protein
MGWFSKIKHKVSHFVTKSKNALTPIVKKGKQIWNKAGQIGSFVHKKVVPKLKLGLEMASATGFLDEFTLPALAALETGDKVLGSALQAKAHIDRTAGRMENYSKRIGKYSKKFSGQLSDGNYIAAVGTAAKFGKDAQKAYKDEKQHYEQARSHFA